MAEQTGAEYGYQSDEVKSNPFDFGLNAGVTYLKSFGYIPNGGKEGAEQDALEIIFTINDTDKSYRRFPVTRGFDKKTGAEITDPESKEFKEALSDFQTSITHILKCFADDITVQTALSKRTKSFKEFCDNAAKVLGKDYSKKKLDIFLHYQWQIQTGKDRTYLDIPGNMKHGYWLCPAKPGRWTEHKLENPSDTDREALWYTNEKGEKHPFIRKGWFMNNPFAKQQREGGVGDDTNTNGAATDTAGEQAAGEAQNAPATGGTRTAW